MNKIYNTDCLEYIKTLPNKSVDLVLTDPPYFIGFDGGKGWDSKWKTEQEYLAKRLFEQGQFYTESQDQLNIERALKNVKLYQGFKSSNTPLESLVDFLKKELSI